MDYKISISISVSGIKDYQNYGSQTINTVATSFDSAEALMHYLSVELNPSNVNNEIIALDQYAKSKETN